METLVTIVKRANGNLFDLELPTLHAGWRTTTVRVRAPESLVPNLAFDG